MDCVGLVLCVAEDLGILDREGKPFLRKDYLNYGPQPVDSFVHAECVRRMVQMSALEPAKPQGRSAKEPQGWSASPALHPADATPSAILRPGQVITLRVPSVPCHVAIVTSLADFGIGLTSSLGMVHAYAGAFKTAENLMDDKWRRRIEGVFDFPGVV